MKKILITTGGSGGHVIPAMNLYYHLIKDFDVKLYSDARGVKYINKDINKHILDVKRVPEKIYFFPLKIFFLFYAFIKSIINLRRNKFDIIISTGGYMSLPLVLAAKLFNMKIFLFEPNSILGRSNKILLNFSSKIFCYDKNLKGLNEKYFNKIFEIPPILSKCYYNNRTENNINADILRILIIGGSQASLFFSNNLKNEIIELSSKYKIEVTQQLPRGLDIDNYKKDYDENKIKNNLFFFKYNFLCENNSFDIAITRSGASSLAELSHLNIPFVAIPFPHATDNHQYLNAKKYHDLNCCWILEEKNFNSGDMAKLINKIFINKNDYLKKKSNLKKLKDKNKWENINNEFKKILNDN